MNKFSISLISAFVLIIVLSSFALSALSSEALAAKTQIEGAKSCFEQMKSNDFPLSRVNESFKDALEQYSFQLALESKGQKTNYNFTIKSAQDVCNVTNLAFLASDELKIFLEFYSNAQKQTNLSEMDDTYNGIVNSFNNSRFEDTPKLINQGYEEISELQSRQTAVQLFYETTSRTLKNFLINNWKEIIIILAISALLLAFFGNTLRRSLIKRKIRNLEIRMKTIDSLIKALQKQYFGSKRISDLEYQTKTKSYHNMILDIERQIPLLKEDLAKTSKRKV